MDETTAAIQRGCRVVRELEENLENLANQPEILTRFCDEIIRVFSYVKGQISYSTMVQDPPHHQEWVLRSGGTSSSQARDHHHHHMLGAAQPRPVAELHLGSGAAGGFDAAMVIEGNNDDDEEHNEPAAPVVTAAGDDHDVQPNATRASSSSSQRQRRRRDGGEKRTVRVPAPRMGNTDIPPEDGYTWRKYGQKDILHSNYPRSYFRCTHQKLYNCPAKKQVQRLDDDPNMFEVIYRGEHTCHLSSTAPSVQPPPPSLQVRSQDLILHEPTAGILPLPPPDPLPASSLSHWLSMDIISPPLITGEGPSNLINFSATAAGGGGGGIQMYRDFSLMATTTTPPVTVTCSSSRGGGAGRSTAGTTRLSDYQPVTDLADVMFNSGSSSNNSMDLIFPSIPTDHDHKWDSGEKK